jgi:hypothetical protein
MSKSLASENALLSLIFNGTSWAGIADNSSSPLTDLYLSLHTADPGDSGSQTTNECSYGSYARVAVARNSGAWTVVANTVENAALVQFPTCASGNQLITHFAVGKASSGAGDILYSGSLNASLNVSSGIQPQFSAGALNISEN